MKRSQPPNPFELENLEQRILLSGDPLVGAGQGIAPDELDPLDMGLEKPPMEEGLTAGEDTSQNPTNLQSLQYDASENLADIFSGFAEEDPFLDQEGDATSEEGSRDYSAAIEALLQVGTRVSLGYSLRDIT